MWYLGTKLKECYKDPFWSSPKSQRQFLRRPNSFPIPFDGRAPWRSVSSRTQEEPPPPTSPGQHLRVHRALTPSLILTAWNVLWKHRFLHIPFYLLLLPLTLTSLRLSLLSQLFIVMQAPCLCSLFARQSCK